MLIWVRWLFKRRYDSPLKRALDACAVLDREWTALHPDYRTQVRITVQRIIERE